MKRLSVKSPAYRYIEKSFKEWLDILGYAEQTVYNMPNHLRELLHWLEQKNITQLAQINAELIRDYYYNHLKNRSNIVNEGALSNGHLNKHLQMLHKFCDYLRQSGRHIISPLNIRMEEIKREGIPVLSEQEIKLLYKACDIYPATTGRKPSWFYPVMALRDKAMLAVYYGCGIRRNEGIHIDLNDIFWDKQLLHIREGKNYKERFVPVSKTCLQTIETYIYDSRPFLLRDNKKEALFINERGHRMQAQMMNVRLQTLISRTEDETLQNKGAGLHTLRHSIATHLLANGMKLEKIKDFLGHSSLESTQIYTHLLKENGYEGEYIN